jgi:hypothetical protein
MFTAVKMIGTEDEAKKGLSYSTTCGTLERYKAVPSIACICWVESCEKYCVFAFDRKL